MPVVDGFPGLVVAMDDLELGQGHGQGPPLPRDRDEYLALGFALGRHADDFDLVAH
jgi:hypothetical protein